MSEAELVATEVKASRNHPVKDEKTKVATGTSGSSKKRKACATSGESDDAKLKVHLKSILLAEMELCKNHAFPSIALYDTIFRFLHKKNADGTYKWHGANLSKLCHDVFTDQIRQVKEKSLTLPAATVKSQCKTLLRGFNYLDRFYLPTTVSPLWRSKFWQSSIVTRKFWQSSIGTLV